MSFRIEFNDWNDWRQKSNQIIDCMLNSNSVQSYNKKRNTAEYSEIDLLQFVLPLQGKKVTIPCH